MTKAIRLALGIVLAVSAVAAGRAAEPKSSDALWYERIEAGCKAEAKRYYSAVHFKKRRLFIKHCIDRAYH